MYVLTCQEVVINKYTCHNEIYLSIIIVLPIDQKWYNIVVYFAQDIHFIYLFIYK